jgi:hypothetical protein
MIGSSRGVGLDRSAAYWLLGRLGRLWSEELRICAAMRGKVSMILEVGDRGVRPAHDRERAAGCSSR